MKGRAYTMKNAKTQNLTRIALLCALLLLMSFTPLGYMPIGPFSVTFLTIPVIVGAVTSGPAVGAFLGLIFGLTSFVNAFSNAMGAVLLNISPVYTFILCVLPRVLEGFLSGLIYKLLNRQEKDKPLSIVIGSLSCPVFNTILYMSTLIILFGNTEYILNLRGGQSVLMFVVSFVGIQAVVEALVCTVIGSAVSMALLRFIKNKKQI